MPELRADLSPAEAAKINQLCGRVLGDVGSIHARIANIQPGGRAEPMAPELVALRRYVREIQDTVQDAYPQATYR
jgi:hypothetical protein